MYANGCCSVGDRSVVKKETEKILKYKDPTIEIQHMWNVKTNVIPESTKSRNSRKWRCWVWHTYFGKY
jgi:hypothetical protein